MNAIEVFMNHTPVGEDSDPHCFALRKRSQRFMLPSFQFITRCLLTTNRASILKVLNPWLPAASEDHVCNLTVATVLRTSRLSQIDRAVSQIDALLERLTKLIKARTTQVLQDNMDLLPPALVDSVLEDNNYNITASLTKLNSHLSILQKLQGAAKQRLNDEKLSPTHEDAAFAASVAYQVRVALYAHHCHAIAVTPASCRVSSCKHGWRAKRSS
ncbi:unnamed protein product [Symbiodinium sp. KB8]|nr:unnamed protein product [Symbiodinium sp. KB8]